MKTLLSIIIGLIFSISSTTHSQSSLFRNPLLHESASSKNIFSIEKGKALTIYADQAKRLKTKQYDPNELTEIIVEFLEPPMFLQSETDPKKLSAHFYFDRFRHFETELKTIITNAPIRRSVSAPSPEIEHTFYKTFFGVSLKVQVSGIPDIARLTYVKSIHLNSSVRANVEDAVSIVRADSVWNQLNVFGDSIVIGILDTGIDYKHPALGGGFGPSKKVIGGYDIVNNDADPLDDNGHGTHVAGISAANGDSLKGIAPHAKLLAVKVLNEFGFGSQADIIKGIEWMADPNNDNNNSDQADIVNVSLGGDGAPDDALSTAANNAVTLGIVFCISAGNGSGFQTIGSPGNAEKAITVGASDKKDKLAYFSSKGPTKKMYTMKPDILAPGVDIRSSTLKNSTEIASGTSMSAPVVSGICALIKSKHPDWTPAMIKSALMNNAVDLGYEAMSQGAGRVDALNAINASSFTFPPHVNFGLDTSEFNKWTAVESVYVVNIAGTAKNYTAKVKSLPSGISLTCTPEQFSVPSKDSILVIISVEANNQLVQFPQQGSLAISGAVRLCSEDDTLRIPWSAVKAAKVFFTFNEPVSMLAISNQLNSFSDDDLTRLSLSYYEGVLPRGTYDIAAGFLGAATKFIVLEKVPLNAGKSVSITSDSAIHSITTSFVDNSGKSLSDPNKNIVVGFPDSSVFRYMSYHSTFEGNQGFYFSRISDRFSVHLSEFSVLSDKHIFVPSRMLKGIAGNKNVGNTPSDYLTQHIQTALPLAGSNTEYHISPIQWSLFQFGENDYFGFGIASGSPYPTKVGSWTGTAYIMGNEPSIVSTTSVEANFVALPANLSSDWLMTPPLTIFNDSIVGGFYPSPPQHAYRSPSGGTMQYGESPIYTDGFHLNNYYGRPSIGLFPYFYGQLDEEKSNRTATYKIFDGANHIIAEDTLSNSRPISVKNGPYRTEVIYNDYYVKGKNGKGTMTSAFDLSHTDDTPPMMTSLRLLNSQRRSVSNIVKGEKASILISTADFMIRYNDYGFPYLAYQAVSDSVQALLRTHGDSAWTTFSVIKIGEDTTRWGKIFSGEVSTFPLKDSSAVDLRIHIIDMSGNTMMWQLEPAFSVGAYTPPVAVTTNADPEIPSSYALYQNFPNPFNPSTVIRFDIPEHNIVRINIFDILGRRVKVLHYGFMVPGSHQILWQADDNAGRKVASGIYFMHMNAGSYSSVRKMTVLK